MTRRDREPAWVTAIVLGLLVGALLTAGIYVIVRTVVAWWPR